MKNQSLLFGTILILLNCRMNPCFAETYRVPIDYGTIQAAVDACIDGDRVLVSDGIYSGIGNTNIDFNGKGITVTSVSGSGGCTIDCMGNGRAFYMHNNEDNGAEIIGFTIINGDVTDGFDQHESGGAVYCSSGSPVIADCNFFDNTATRGGAIYINAVDGTIPVIRNCHFSRNHSISGGAVYIFDSIKIAACRFDNNTASYGGAVIVSMTGDTTIGGSPEEGNLFESNFAPVGADLCGSGADVNATFNTFEGNCLSDYYVSHPYCFNLENCVSGTPLIYQDVYVSPHGDDANDGLTMETAFKTIQHAMSRICADHGQYFTVFLDRGRYSPSATGEIYPLPCLPNISLKGAGMDETVLDAEQTGRVIHYSEDDNISIEDLTVSNGRASSGAGMYCFCRSTSNFSIRNCCFTDNTTEYDETCGGGGVTVTGWRGPTISECVFTRNFGYTGGGLWTKTSYSTRIRDCDFTENAAYQGGGLALDDAGDTEVTRCSIMYNSAELGAGVAYVCGGTVRNSTISNNYAGNCGGGVYGDVPRYRESHGRLENCVISGNTADTGAGFHVHSLDCSSLFRIVNCTVYGNRAGTHGGGGAGDAIWFSDDDSPTIVNSIVWANVPDGLWFGNTGETPALISYSLTQDGNQGIGNMMLDPLFTDPVFQKFTVSGFSPCIDTGTDEDAPVDDFDGYDRPRGGAVDIGAHEYPGWPLTSRVYITMPSHGFCPGDTCSLSVTVWNREMLDLVDYPLFVMLQMGDEAFWVMGPPETDSNIFTFPEGLSDWKIISPFPWPDTSTTASGLVWYAAVTDPDVSCLVGNVGAFDFGWE